MNARYRLNVGKAITYMILAAVLSAIISVYTPFAFIPGTLLATAWLYFTSPSRRTSIGQPTLQQPTRNSTAPTVGTTSGAKFCKNCGAPLNQGIKFCTSCGVRVG